MKNLIKLLIITLVMLSISFQKNDLQALPTTLNLKCYFEGFYSPPIHRMNNPIPVTVLLCNAAPPYNVISTANTILDVNGNNFGISFNIPSNGNYYIVVKSWNMIETWSASPRSFINAGTTNYDFSTSFSQAFGNNLKFLENVFGVYGGDINQDMLVDLFDILLTYNESFNYASGNLVTDLSGDEITDVDDLLIIDNNAFNFVSSIRP